MTKPSSRKVIGYPTNLGISYLKLRLKEYNDSDKSAEMADYLAVSVARFIYSSDQQANFADELKFWVEHTSTSFSSSLNQPLSLISTPNDASLIEIGSNSLDLSDLDLGPKLKDLMFEIGPTATTEEERMSLILSRVRLTERDIMDTINMMVENSPFVEPEASQKELSRVSKHVYFEMIKGHKFDNPDSVVPAANFEQKPPTQWNYSVFVKAISDAKKVNWSQVFKQMDNPFFQLSSKRAFQEFLQVCDIVRDSQKWTFPRELMVGRWDNIRAQLNFIQRFIEHGKTDISLYKDLKNKNLVDFDATPSVRNTTGFINSGMEIWLFKDFVVRLIELSESSHYAVVRGWFE